MTLRRLLFACAIAVLASLVIAQTLAPSIQNAPSAPQDYVCPMDRDVRDAAPGKCPRCGMSLVLGIPDPVEYPLELALIPRASKPRRPVDLVFRVKDPKTGA